MYSRVYRFIHESFSFRLVVHYPSCPCISHMTSLVNKCRRLSRELEVQWIAQPQWLLPWREQLNISLTGQNSCLYGLYGHTSKDWTPSPSPKTSAEASSAKSISQFQHNLSAAHIFHTPTFIQLIKSIGQSSGAPPSDAGGLKGKMSTIAPFELNSPGVRGW
jgi:hypothetical protein